MRESDDLVIIVVNDQAVHLSEVVRSLSVDGNWDFFERFARRQVIVQLAKRHGIAFSNEDLQVEVDEWRHRNQLERPEDTDAWLKRHGITLQDVAKEAEFWLHERGLMLQITDDSIRSFFVRNSIDFESVEIHWIAVADECLAEELCWQVSEENACFFALARRHSQDKTTRPAGGYLGRRRRTELPQGVAPLVFAASEGQVVGPLKVETGYAIYRVQKRYHAVLDESTREQIRKRLFEISLVREMKRAEITYSFAIR